MPLPTTSGPYTAGEGFARLAGTADLAARSAMVPGLQEEIAQRARATGLEGMEIAQRNAATERFNRAVAKAKSGKVLSDILTVIGAGVGGVVGGLPGASLGAGIGGTVGGAVGGQTPSGPGQEIGPLLAALARLTQQLHRA